jgi:hypothetical protein
VAAAERSEDGVTQAWMVRMVIFSKRVSEFYENRSEQARMVKTGQI